MPSNTQHVQYVEWFTKTDEFRERANFFDQHGRYTLLTKGTKEYNDFWLEEDRRCREGITNSVGITITGVHYFYLNYVRIKSEDLVTGRKKFNFPRFLDIDYDYFHLVEVARKMNKGLIFTKPRRTGFSYKDSALVTHEYNFYRDSVCVIGAFLEKLSTTTMNMVLDNMNFLNANTEWRKQRNPDTKDFVKARFEKNIDGIKVWAGYMSEVKKLTFKDNPFAAVGLTTNIFIFEEAGTLANLRDCYGITEPCWKDGDNMVGIPIIFGTGGDMEKGTADFAYMFTNPKQYNLLEFDNIWEPGREGNKCGWFIPATRGRLGIYKDELGRHPEWKGKPMVDKDGNSIEEIALASIMDYRDIKRRGGDPKNIQDSITQYPLTPSESFLRSSGAIFSSIELHEWLSKLETTPSLREDMKKVDLYFDENNKIKSRLNPDLIDIKDYPLNRDEPKTGCVVIWEDPIPNPPFGLYIMGCLTPGEKVLTHKGLMNVEDVTVDEQLVNQEGNLVKIINLQRYLKEDESTYELKISNTYRTTKFTQEHPIYVSDNILRKDLTVDEDLFKFNYVRAKYLKKDQWIKCPNIYNKENEYDKIPYLNISNKSKEYINNFWWFVGVWLGDGWCESNGYNVSISFNITDIYYIEKTKHIINNYFNRSSQIRVRGNCLQMSFSCKELNTWLTDNFGKYSYGKYIPEWAKYISKESKYNLIGGYLASDGSVCKNNKYYSTEFVSINLELLESIQDILFSIGIVSGLTKLRDEGFSSLRKNSISLTKKCYHLRLGIHSTIKLKNILDNTDPKLEKVDVNVKLRKEPKNGCFISKCGNYIYFKIRDIKEDKYTGWVYNFECDTHTFMCHHITTHNCDPFDQDKADTSESLGSVFVYKRFITADKTHDILVAEYTGRPARADDFYEIVRRLCLYYNAKCLYENNLKGLKAYFEQKNNLHLLYEQPQIIKDFIKDSKVNRGYGIHMSEPIKDQCEIYVRDWLYKERMTNDGIPIMNLHTIRSIPLLKELIAYDREINTDRVIAFMLCILQSQELHKIHISEMEPKTILDMEAFWTRNFFKKNTNQYIRNR